MKQCERQDLPWIYGFHRCWDSPMNPVLLPNISQVQTRQSTIPVSLISTTDFDRFLPSLVRHRHRSLCLSYVSYSSTQHSNVTAKVKCYSVSRYLEAFTSETTAVSSLLKAIPCPVSKSSVQNVYEQRLVNALAVCCKGRNTRGDGACHSGDYYGVLNNLICKSTHKARY